MAGVDIVIWLSAFAITVLAVTSLARRFGLSAPLLLVLIGVLASYLPVIPTVHLTADVILIGLLPPLLYAAAVNQSLIDFRHNIASIGWLSVGLVLFTMVGIGVIVHTLMPVGWAAAFALGAIVSPPDPVATTAIASAVGFPRRVVTILEGEGLVNDAAALVSLRSAVAAIGASVSFGWVSLDFLKAVAISVVTGLVVARIMAFLFGRTKDMNTGTALTFIVPFLAYVPADELGGSGVLAVVVAGLALGHAAPRVQENGMTRLSTRVNWSVIQYLLENSVFLLIGLQVQGVVADALQSDLSGWRIVAVCAASVAGVIVLRVVWVLGTRAVVHRAREQSPPFRESLVIAWAGMRGVVTLAAALTLPPIPNRAVLILAAVSVTIGTLVIQGLTLPAVARVLDISGPDPREDALQEAILYQRAARAGMRRAREVARPEDDKALDRVERIIQLRGNQAWERLGRDPDSETPSDSFRRLRMAALDAERDEVLRIRDDGKADDQVISRVLAELDGEEITLTRVQKRSDLVRETPLRPRLADAPCVHLAHSGELVVPASDLECQDCLVEGTVWVHLRMCLTCGNVGCCDSSEARHAERHFHRTGHPTMRSIEPGESWRWCYIDEVIAAGD